MSNVFLTSEVTNAIITIAVELEKANKLKRVEMELEHGKILVKRMLNEVE